MSEMTTPVSELLRKYDCTRNCCGRCIYWHTETMIGGEFCGWIGSCNHETKGRYNIEADDWCSGFEKYPEEGDEDDGRDC